MAKNLPVLWSFRRCPYAMRARLALAVSGQKVALREIVLRDKPEAMLAVSPKGTVPILVHPDGAVLEESLEIMAWALAKNDPKKWQPGHDQSAAAMALIARNDGPFKYHLDRYKYPDRYGLPDGLKHRAAGLEILAEWDRIISEKGQFLGGASGLVDYAIFPFVRQFANTDRAWFDQQDLPALRPWLEQHLASSLFEEVMIRFPLWREADPEVTLFPV